MTKKEIVKRYFIFIIGLFFSSLGVSFVTKAKLGTSPISSIPYVLSLGFWPTLGQFTIIFSLFLIVLQIILLGRKFQKSALLQIPVSVLFGYFIDWTMLLLTSLNPTYYTFKVISLLIGCVILAFGVYLEVIANVVMLPGESFVKAVTIRFHTDFGITKVGFDASMTVIAGVISFVLFHKLVGVREGTIIAAMVVGLIAKFFGKILSKFTDFLLPSSAAINKIEVDKKEIKENYVITIGREYGSSGREIGRAVAKKLGIAYYDSELIALAAKESGYTESYVAKNEQKLTNSILYDLYVQYYAYASDEMPKYKVLFQAEQKVIKELAAKSSCVIVGRMSNVALRDYEKAFHVFISADLDAKIQHVMEREGRTMEEARKKIAKVDLERKHHCKYFTDTEWGNAANYDITIKASRFGANKTADIIIELAKKSGFALH